MSLTHPFGGATLATALSALAIAGAGFAQAGDANSEVLAEIAALKAEIARVRASQGDNWLTDARATEIRSLVQDVLSDADTRASLQSSGMTAGWDKGFFLASPDGNFKLKIKGQIQFRYVLNYRDIQGAVQGDRWTHGFENRRTKLAFEGNVIDKTWLYKVQGAFSRSDGGMTLEDAWIQKDFENGFYIRAGQFKAPYLREESVSSSRQLAVERSLLNEAFNQDFSQGVEAGWESDMFRAAVMFSDGIGGNNFTGASTKNTAWNARTTEYAFTGRAEFLVAGAWKQFDDFTSFNGEAFGLMIGVAGNWQTQEYGTSANNEQEQLGFTADISAEFGGANLYAAFIYNNPDVDNAAGLEADQYGFVVQGGIFVMPDSLELFARYEWADADYASAKDLNVITAGFNWYFSKHAAKFTLDAGYSLEDFGSTWASSGAGWLNGFNEEEWVFRGQFQLLF